MPVLPNMSRAVERWSSNYLIKTVVQQTVDFVRSDVVTSRTIRAMVQVANKEKLSPDAIDWSRRYILIHTLDDSVVNGEFIEYQGGDYKVIDNGDYTDFGYIEFVAEETKQILLQVTP